MTPHEPPSVRYAQAVARGELKAFASQQVTLPHLDALHTYALHPPAPQWRWWRRRNDPQLVAPQLYLWGPPGAGKTHLMDLLVTSLPAGSVRRYHMHTWLDELQQSLNHRTHPSEDVLTRYIDQQASTTTVLCLDECFVDDITTACWLSRLLPWMTASRMAVVMTSNQHPTDLYQGGVQRQRFLPTIDHVQDTYHVHHVDPGEDCRQMVQGPNSYRSLHAPHVHVTPTGAPTTTLLQTFHATRSLPEPSCLTLHGRSLQTLGQTDQSLHLDFLALITSPRSYRDVLALAARYDRLMISGLCPLEASDHGRILNWIHAMDVLIDATTDVWLVSTVPMAAVYPTGRYHERFQRTLSRLTPRQLDPT